MIEVKQSYVEMHFIKNKRKRKILPMLGVIPHMKNFNSLQYAIMNTDKCKLPLIKKRQQTSRKLAYDQI